MKTILNVNCFVFLVFCVGIYAQEGTNEQNRKSSLERPNIVWLIADDLSANDLPVYGNELIHTPNIDKLAASGIQFNRAYATSAVCAPSRTAMLIGKYQTSIGATHMKFSEELFPELPDSIRTVFEVFNANDYNTVSFQRTSLETYGTVDKSLHWMYQRRDGMESKTKGFEGMESKEPFFSLVDFKFPHRYFVHDSINPINANEIDLPPYYPDNKIVRADWKLYFESIQNLDRNIGQFLGEMEKRGLMENTIIIFSSDHGRPMTRGKYWMYESGIKVPLIIYLPEAYRDTFEFYNNEELVSLIDLVPTSLHLAGIKIPEYIDGKSLFQDHKREHVFAAADRISELHFRTRAIITDQYKYIHNYNHDAFDNINEATTVYARAHYLVYHVIDILSAENKLNEAQKSLVKPIREEELYDLSKDPYELSNLAYEKEYKGIKDSLQLSLQEWIIQSGDQGIVPDRQEVVDFFESMGENNRNRYKEDVKELRMEVSKQLK